MPPPRTPKLHCLHPLAILRRDTALRPSLPHVPARHLTQRVKARPRRAAVDNPPQPSRRTPPPAAARSRDTRSSDDPRRRETRPTDDALMSACRAGFVPVDYDEAVALLNFLQVNSHVPRVDDMVKMAQSMRVSHDLLASVMTRISRLIAPVKGVASRDRRQFAESLLYAASKLGSAEAIVDLAALSFGPAMIPTVRMALRDGSPYRQRLLKCARSDGEHAIEAMVLYGTLLDSEGRCQEAKRWLEQAAATSREPTPDSNVYDGPLSYLQAAPHPAATFSHPASRALMELGRGLYEDPRQPLQKSRRYFQRAAEQYDDPTAYSFLARCYETDTWDVRLYNAKKAAAAGDKHAASFLGAFYAQEGRSEDLFPRNDAHALAEWACADAPVHPAERRCLLNPPDAFESWWRVDGGAARERRTRAIRWFEMAGTQEQPQYLAMATYMAGFAAVQGLRTAEHLEGQATFHRVCLRQTIARSAMFSELRDRLSIALEQRPRAVERSLLSAIDQMAALAPSVA